MCILIEIAIVRSHQMAYVCYFYKNTQNKIPSQTNHSKVDHVTKHYTNLIFEIGHPQPLLSFIFGLFKQTLQKFKAI